MDRRKFLKSSIGCMCLALLPPFSVVVCPPNRTPVLADLDAFHQDWDAGILENIYDKHIIFMPLKNKGEPVWLGEHTSQTQEQVS